MQSIAPMRTFCTVNGGWGLLISYLQIVHAIKARYIMNEWMDEILMKRVHIRASGPQPSNQMTLDFGIAALLSMRYIYIFISFKLRHPLFRLQVALSLTLSFCFCHPFKQSLKFASLTAFESITMQ
eukprot:scaffold385893_cov20-Prasinocladus_malaysianus.AAC.1